MHYVRVMFVAAAVCVMLDGGLALAQPTGVSGYEVIDLGVVPDQSVSGVQGLDDFGRVAGDSGRVLPVPYVWVNGELLVIPAPPGYERPRVNDIGNGPVAAGWATLSGSPDWHPVLWTATQGIFVLDLLPGTAFGSVRSVDDRRWPLTGSAGFCNAGVDYATAWHGPIATQIGSARSGADAINNLGHVVGTARNQLGVSRPTLWRDGQTIDIGGEPYDQDGTATGVNDWTEAVGNLPDLRRPFRWFNGHTALLHKRYPCNTVGQAWAVNNAGLIAGQDARPDCGGSYAMIWERLTPRAEVPPEYAVFDLNEFIPRHPNIELLDAKDINDAGQMAVFGEYTDGRERGFLVTPYRFEMSDPVPGRAGTVNTITVTGLQPNQRVHLVWGTQEGAQKVRAACPGGTLLIRDPQGLPAVRADANGVATINVNVPLIARGRTVRLQAVAPIECQISHTVTWTFE